MNELKIKVQAAMETGNTGVARLVFRELLELNCTAAIDLNNDVIASYGVDLL